MNAGIDADSDTATRRGETVRKRNGKRRTEKQGARNGTASSAENDTMKRCVSGATNGVGTTWRCGETVRKAARVNKKIGGEIDYNSANFGIAVKLSLYGDEYGTVATMKSLKSGKTLPLPFLFCLFCLYDFFICPFNLSYLRLPLT